MSNNKKNKSLYIIYIHTPIWVDSLNNLLQRSYPSFMFISNTKGHEMLA